MIKSYFAFVNKIFFYLGLAIIVGLLAVAALAIGVGNFFSSVLMVVLPVFQIIVLSMLDFFTFGGIAVKKQKLMEYVKSSLAGKRVVKESLTADAVMIFIKMLVLAYGVVVLSVIFGQEPDYIAMYYLLPLAIASVSTMLMFISQIITRKFCQSLVAHMMISYILNFFMSLVYIPVLFVFAIKNAAFAAITVTVITMGLAVLAGWLLIKNCMAGYESGFCDK